jgi:hypothetical protein
MILKGFLVVMCAAVLFVPAAHSANAVNSDVVTFYPAESATYTTISTTGPAAFSTNNTSGRSVIVGRLETDPLVLSISNVNGSGGDVGVDLDLTGSIVQDPWTEVVGGVGFQNGWVNFPAGQGYNSAGYFRDKNGIVHLKGLVRGGAIPSVIFQLPAGFCPARNEHFFVGSSNAAGIDPTPGAGAYVRGRLIVGSGCGVQADCGSSTNFFQLDGISFRASGY